MNRAYTDERFPGVTLVNQGGTCFEVRVNGEKRSVFETWEKPGGEVGDAFAARIAESCFNRLARRKSRAFYGSVTDAPAVLSESGVSGVEISRLLVEARASGAAAARDNLARARERQEPLALAVVNHLLDTWS